MGTPRASIQSIRREQSSEKFRYDTPTGQIVLPHASRLYSDMAAKMRHISVEERVFWLIEQVLEGEQLELFDSLTGRQQKNLIDDWMAHGGVRLGELTGLLEIIEEHTAALEGDLMHYFHILGGVDEFLDDTKFSWRRRVHIVWWLNRTVESALHMSRNEMQYRWSNTASSGAATVNALRGIQKMLAREQMKKGDFFPTPFEGASVAPKKKTDIEIRAAHARTKKQIKVEASPEVIAQILGNAPLPQREE